MMRGLGVREEPLRLLRAVKGLDLVDLPYSQDCCGFGGTFAVKMADISEAMLEDKLARVGGDESRRAHRVGHGVPHALGRAPEAARLARAGNARGSSVG